MQPDGSFTFTPEDNFYGETRFSYVVSDGQGGTASAEVVITVRSINDPPTIMVPGAATVEEDVGGLLGTIRVADVDTDVLIVDLQLDHGSVSLLVHPGVSLSGVGGSVTLTGSQADLNTTLASLVYVGAPNYHGPDMLRITASDGSLSTNATVAITVSPVNDPPANLTLTLSLTEIAENGSTLLSGSFTDPDTGNTHRVAIDWGDGTANFGFDLPAGLFMFSGPELSHRYVDNPPNGSDYTITVVVTDQDGAVTTATTSVVVTNVPPAAAFANGGAVNEGSPGSVSFSAQFDPSAADTQAGFLYSYDFNNDGDFDDPGEVQDSTAASAIVPAAYLDDNPSRTVRGQIKDRDGAFTDYTTTITVNNVPPSLVITGPPVSFVGVPCQPLTITLNVSDASPADQANHFTFDIDWGDGTTQILTGFSGMGASNDYAGSGSFLVQATARDKDDGLSDPASTTLTVTNTVWLQGNVLAVGGTPLGDTFTINPGPSAGEVEVLRRSGGGANNSLGIFRPSTVQIFGCSGAGDSVVINGSSSENTFDVDLDPFSGLPRVTYNGLPIEGSGIETWNANGRGGDDQFTWRSGAVVIDGAGGRDTLINARSAGEWRLWAQDQGSLGLPFSATVSSFTNIENLTGSAGVDRFRLEPSGRLGGTLDGSGGADILDYSLYGGAVTIDPTSARAPGINPFVGIEQFVGSPFADTFAGPNAFTNWDITGPNRGTLSPLTGTRFDFSSFENLEGDRGTDLFRFQAGGSVSGLVDGGNGTAVDSLNYSAFNIPATVDLQSNAATATGGFRGIEQVAGTYGFDTLVGPNRNNSWILNDLTNGRVADIRFFNFENLRGGNRDDDFQLGPNALGFGTLDGDGGSDTLSYSTFASPVIINLQRRTAPRINSFEGIETLVGSYDSGLRDVLVGTDAGVTTWTITGPDSGTVSTPAGPVDFYGFPNLTGGSSYDFFAFPRGRTYDQVRGTIDGGAGFNWLDYSALSFRQDVNLTTGIVSYGAARVRSIDHVRGSRGDDLIVGNANGNTLNGNEGNDVLLGGGGNDDLQGGPGRDILVGGTGSDILRGDNDGDILVGGSLVSSYYNESTGAVNTLALNSILLEWTRSLPGNQLTKYRSRVDHLLNGGGSNGPYRLNSTTVLSDQAVDTLLGGTDLDWFLVDPFDSATKETDEILTTIL